MIGTGKREKDESGLCPKYFSKLLFWNLLRSILLASSGPIVQKNWLNPFAMIEVSEVVVVEGWVELDAATGIVKVDGREEEDLFLPVTSFINCQAILGSFIEALKDSM